MCIVCDQPNQWEWVDGDESKMLQAIPLGDLKPHTKKNCPCKVRYTFKRPGHAPAEGYVWHKSFDNREANGAEK